MHTKLSKLPIFLIIVCSTFFITSCGGGGGSDREVNIQFSAKVAGDTFACGSNYQGIGTTKTSITPQDLRFYVHSVNLVNSEGQSVPMSIEDDGIWQRDGLALIDFENGTGGCSAEGTAETNTTLRGTAPEGNYVGVNFVVGVPFEMNHIDAQTAKAPQNITAMWWNWNAGYKFLKFDVSSTGLASGWRVHIGSTGCTGNEAGSVNQCTKTNSMNVNLTSFNPDSQTIALELAGLLDSSNVDFNTAQTAPGCMSGPTDPECPSIFSKLGLSTGGQTLFYVE